MGSPRTRSPASTVPSGGRRGGHGPQPLVPADILLGRKHKNLPLEPVRLSILPSVHLCLARRCRRQGCHHQPSLGPQTHNSQARAQPWEVFPSCLIRIQFQAGIRDPGLLPAPPATAQGTRGDETRKTDVCPF